MDVNELIGSLSSQLGETLPSLIGALLILVVGWFVAIVVRAIVRRSLKALGANERIASSTGNTLDVEGGTAAVFYYVILALVAVAFFDAMNLTQVSTSVQGLVDQILGYAPKLIAAGVLALVAWLIATILRSIVTQALSATSMDEKLGSEAGMRPMSDSLGPCCTGWSSFSSCRAFSARWRCRVFWILSRAWSTRSSRCSPMFWVPS